MPTDVLQKTGTAIVLGNAAAHNGSVAAANNLGNVTDEIDLTDLAALAARQSAKFDFGATRARAYNMMAALEFATAPAAGETVDFYLAFSNSLTAANANPGGVSGADAAYAGYSANLTDSLKQLTFIGSMSLTVQATGDVQIADIGTFFAEERYATLIVVNSSAVDDLHSDVVEMSVLISPVVDEIQ